MDNLFSVPDCQAAEAERTEKAVTTKELAEVLGVDVKTVNNTIERLLGSTFQKSEIKTVAKGGRPTKVFTEEQATLIKQEIQKHHNLASRQIDTVSTEYEENQTIANAIETLQVQENDGIQSVSARELYKGLQIKLRFSQWWENNSKDFVENEDFTTVLVNTEVQNNGGVQVRELEEHYISLDMAKAICLMSRTEIGKKYRLYLISLEKAWNSPEMVMKRALQIADRKVKEMEAKLAEQKPKVDYVDAYCDSENLEEIGHLGKATKIGEKKIFNALLKDGFIKVRRSTDGVRCYDPCYGYEKYFETVHVPFLRGDKKLSRDKLMLNHRGFMFFRAKYAAEQIAAQTPDRWIEK